MSSHREAPSISKDPVADSTDLYAFVSPDPASAGTVTLISNYIPLEAPDGGPNFYEFGDDVLYEIRIDNNGDAIADVIYQFRFHTEVRSPATFLYNTGQIATLDSTFWNRRQFYSVTRVRNGNSTLLGTELMCPPCNIGPRSTPNYAALAGAAVQTLPGGAKVFAGQRREGFYIDLGAIFDLGVLRPFQNLHLIPSPAALGVDATKAVNVHSIAIQVPISDLTRDGSAPTTQTDSRAVIGVWCVAQRQKVQMGDEQVGPWRQVSRLGNPLVNEVVIPMGLKDYWNTQAPEDDGQFLSYVLSPELSKLLPVLYPDGTKNDIFPNLAAYTKPRADLKAILMTGIPSGILTGFQNFTGSKPADMLRLNVAISPTQTPNPLGVVGGDLAGYPNGRRVFDDVFTIELRAFAGLTIPLVDKSFTPDGAASAVSDNLTPAADRFISTFPYLGVPLDGFNTPSA